MSKTWDGGVVVMLRTACGCRSDPFTVPYGTTRWTVPVSRMLSLQAGEETPALLVREFEWRGRIEGPKSWPVRIFEEVLKCSDR